MSTSFKIEKTYCVTLTSEALVAALQRIDPQIPQDAKVSVRISGNPSDAFLWLDKHAVWRFEWLERTET